MSADSSHASVALVRLLQLVSPALPVGAFAYSDAMEYAVSAGWVADAPAAEAWIRGRLESCLGRVDVPILLRMHGAWAAGDEALARDWSEQLVSLREAAELRQADRDIGASLARLLGSLGIPEAAGWLHAPHVTHAAMFALAAARWSVDAATAAQGFAFAWAESQVTAAVKLIPLGQSAGQRALMATSERIPAMVARAQTLQDDDIGAGAPGLAIAASRHETMYARLFRS